MRASTAAAIVIGNEILSGKIEDRNTPVLARELRALGVDLRRVVIVPDQIDAIVEAVHSVQAAHDVVFTSGGVGPTHDDVTLEAIACALGRRLVRSPEMERLVTHFYGDRASPASFRMADLPEGAELVHGEGLRVPVVVVDNLYVLPGLPGLFARKIVALRERFRGAPYHLRQVYVASDEGEIASALAEVVELHPAVELGSYPAVDAGDHRVKLTLESKDREVVELALATLRRLLAAEAIVRIE